ncbi:MAG TPA: hypothetical protein H9742_11370 [Candidatus Acetatifactor stercoripullorum]|uniref:Type IV leader peptidase family protein n=1 Tax=Candidatus Acetatifactor stercoripullorum TaxID=2838414 RepID=A0A9D1UBV3_9FIRM|nr:hypothetical protein [uncultured Acetatifactor sp.]HIW82092.1 hypothetical protein [Candidatus Acetatifactor stercoripullorum]
MLIFLMTRGALFQICSLDKEMKGCEEILSGKGAAVFGALCCINGVMAYILAAQKANAFFQGPADGCYAGLVRYLLFCVTAACFLLACIEDCWICQVHNFVWWTGAAAGAGLLFSAGENRGNVFDLLLFILLQELFFCRFYGRADCHSFCVCAMVQCALGAGFTAYLFLMLLAVGMLGLVQAFRHNINKKGNLKIPVPFLPYITISLWPTLFLVYLFKHS